eukprot:1396470-Pleurochrysis_carterae.AAC.5
MPHLCGISKLHSAPRTKSLVMTPFEVIWYRGRSKGLASHWAATEPPRAWGKCTTTASIKPC